MTSIVLVFVLVPSLAQAEVVPVEGLEDRAVAQSPALRAARAAVRSAEADGDEAAAARMPTLGLRAEASVSPGGQLVEVQGENFETEGDTFRVQAAPTISDADAFNPVPRYGATASARWRVLDFGRSSAAEQAADLGAEAGRLEAEAAEHQIRVAVRRAYLGWIVAEQLRVLAVEGSRAAFERAARVQELVSRGQRPESENAAAAVDKATSQLELARAEARAAAARTTLEGVVGEALPEGATPDEGFLEADRPDEGDPADRSLQAQRAAAGALADVQSYRYRPVLDLEADAGLRGQSDSQFPVYRGAVVFSLPLWDGGAGSARERGARADAERIDAQLDLHRRTRAAEESLARSTASQATATRDAAHALVEAAQSRLAAAEAAYDRGVGSTELIASARESLRRARVEEITARAELAQAGLR